ncbi:MAG: hypothetical protein FD146_1065 [Anaerolineaceae bacterium]|nr:MAG: hypothetical protein FD146_1065 [Anaerolineaceae bacterium]
MISHNPKPIRHILLFMCLGVMTVFTITCVTIVPRSTQTPVPVTETSSATATSTAKPSSTFTATPPPAWIADFAEPILEAIANRPPTYQDDFSNPASGWYIGTTTGHPDVLISGDRRYSNGEYRVIANGATTAEPTVCSGGPDENVGIHADFVAEFDVRFVSGNEGDWQIQFHRIDKGLYSLSLDRDNVVRFSKCDPTPGCEGIASYSGGQINDGQEWNHMLLIVRGAKMAAYTNGSPILYLDDKTYSDKFRAGDFSLSVCNGGIVPMETRWDNFRLWDISDLP